MPFFSVILATRDRPELFSKALQSVLAQEKADFEVIVVDDGSTAESRARYAATLDRAAIALGERLRLRQLERRPKGHGQSYALNTGVSAATGAYVCFLDDDDCWTDSGHLARAARAIDAGGGADLYMANQIAYRGEVRQPGPAWLEDLAAHAARQGIVPRDDGVFVVGVPQLITLSGFCHVNALIVRRAFYEAIGGMDEGIRWECDLDLFLRLIDRAETILHHPAVVSRHNVPDPAMGASMTTSLAIIDRWLYRLRVMDKACACVRHPAIRAYAMQHKAYTLKRIAEDLRAAEQWRAAAYYAREALGAGPTAKWLIFTLYCGAMAALRGDGRLR